MKNFPKHINTEFNIPSYANQAIEILNFNGFNAFAAGGCVRDSILGIVPQDWDICTDATPNEIKKAFVGFHIIETGIKHGTVTVRIEHRSVEITTYRIDGEYSDNRRPDKVEFVTDLKEDLKRRDFTINAMAYSPKTGLIDYFDGVDDLKYGLIRAVGDASARFNEDSLRIMRALRFASVYGFIIDEKTSTAIKSNYHLLSNISVERIFSEFIKLLLGDGCFEVLDEYKDVITFLIPELMPCIAFDQNTPHHSYDLWHHTLLAVEHAPKDKVVRLALLFHDIAKPECETVDQNGISHFKGHPMLSAKTARTILSRLKCDKKSTSQICQLITLHDTRINPDNPTVKRLLHDMGVDLFRKLLVVKRADNLAKTQAIKNHRIDEVNQLEEILARIIQNNECYTLDTLAISGSDLVKYGFHGRQIGDTLNNLLMAVIDESVENTKQALLASLNITERQNTDEQHKSSNI